MQLRLLFVVIILISTVSAFSQERPYQFKDVGVSTEIGRALDTDIILTDRFDKRVDIRRLLSSKPSVVNFVYLNCPMLCHLMLDGVLDVIGTSNYEVGDDFQIITISIDPNETNHNLMAYETKYLNGANKDNGWLFLKGTAAEISRITAFFGYQYQYIKRTNDYAHPSILFFYDDKISNYIEGVTFDSNAFDYALMTIKSDKSLKEKIITFCYYFDPDTQTYSLLIINILRLLCLITVVILFIITGRFFYLERRAKKLRK